MENQVKQSDYFFDTLEQSNGNIFRDTFYYLMQEAKTIDIKKCFIKQSIMSKINEEVISFGLMGAARSNKLQNAITLLDCGEKYKKIELNNISVPSAINLAIKKDYVEFAEYLIEKSDFLRDKTLCFINDSDDGFCSSSWEEPQYSVVAEKYNKYGGSSLEFFAHDRDKLAFVLEQIIDVNKIVNFIGHSVKKSNMTALLGVVKSQYLIPLIENNEFKIFMNSDKHREIKNEFQNLINNALLESRLNEKLTIKNNTSPQKKI